MKIAILGSTGHVGKNLTYYFGKEKNYELFLFTRDDKNNTNISVECELKNNFSIKNYNEFVEAKYDVMINCVGLSDPAKIESSQGKILETTEKFDTMTLNYLEKLDQDIIQEMVVIQGYLNVVLGKVTMLQWHI